MTPPSKDDHRGAWSDLVFRGLPLVLVLAVPAFVVATGLYRYLTLEKIARHYELLEHQVSSNWAMAILGYTLFYAAAVAVSIPGSLVLTMAGGLLFGWLAGAAAAATGATLGATALFLLARSSLGEPLAARAGPWLTKLRRGFQDDALSYLLFLRLTPAFPFFVVNLAPAFLGVPLRTFVLGTAIGILPATVIFAVTGDGLAGLVRQKSVLYRECQARQSANPGMNCAYSIETSTLVTPELMLALAGLGCLALLPVVVNRWKRRHGQG